MTDAMQTPAADVIADPKADPADFSGRFREVISDPLNLLIERVPNAGFLKGSLVYLHNGLVVPIQGPHAYYGQMSQLLAVNRGVHEPMEEYVFQEVLKCLPEQPSMIELGAYWSHYSMWFKQTHPDGSAIMVEPEPECLAAGQHNFDQNGFTGEFINAFVGTAQFEIDPFFRERSIRHLNILHADIQGYEVEMLRGAQDALENDLVDYIFISTHSQELHLAVVERLTMSGYRVEVSSDFDNQTTSYDGFVFASSVKVEPVFANFKPLGRKEINRASPAQLLASLSRTQTSKTERVNDFETAGLDV